MSVVGLGLLVMAGTAQAKPGEGNGKGKSEAPAKGRGASPDFVPPGLADKGVPPGHRRAPVEFIVTQAPPPIRAEVIPTRLSPRHVWVPGFWVWESDAYVWIPGAWMLPPEPSAVWMPPRYETRNRVSIFVSGFWKL